MAELAFHGGLILNSATPRHFAAITVENGKIKQAFTTESTFANYTKRNPCQLINLQGQVLIPGQIDAHVPAVFMSQFALDGSLERVTDSLTALTRIRQQAKTTTDTWVRMTGWRDSAVPLDRAQLDGAVADRPVVVFNASFHGAIYNTKAIEVAAQSGVALPQGEGYVTGPVFEDFLEKIRPEPKQMALQILAYQEKMLSLGITGVHDMLIRFADELDVLAALNASGALKLKWPCYVLDPGLLHKAPHLKEHGIEVMGCKIFIDGAYGVRTAWQDKAHAYPDGTTGDAKLSASDIVAIGRKVAEAGCSHIAAHCIGYQACATLVAATEKLRESIYTRDLVIRAEHFETVDEDLMHKALYHNIYICMQPHFAQDVVLYKDRIPHPEHINPMAMAARVMKDLFSIGSDGMPLGLLQSAALALYPPLASQKAAGSFVELLPALSRYAARITGDHTRVGSFAMGMQADFVVLNKLPKTRTDFKTTKVIETWVAGAPVWSAQGAAEAVAGLA